MHIRLIGKIKQLFAYFLDYGITTLSKIHENSVKGLPLDVATISLSLVGFCVLSLKTILN
jgi:hypothetical protein